MAAKVTFICLVLFVATAIAQDCGKLQGANIEDKNNKLPWLVQVRERMTNDVLCSGTLISPSHVLVCKCSPVFLDNSQVTLIVALTS